MKTCTPATAPTQIRYTLADLQETGRYDALRSKAMAAVTAAVTEYKHALLEVTRLQRLVEDLRGYEQRQTCPISLHWVIFVYGTP
jgi:hypothetical protein